MSELQNNLIITHWNTIEDLFEDIEDAGFKLIRFNETESTIKVVDKDEDDPQIEVYRIEFEQNPAKNYGEGAYIINKIA